MLTTGVSYFHGGRGYPNRSFLVFLGEKRNGCKQIDFPQTAPTDDVQNQYGCPASNLSDGRLERTRIIKQQGNTGGVPAKVPPMPLSVICRK